MIGFFFPILEHFCHFSYELPRWVSFCPEYHRQPLFFTQPSQTLLGTCTLANTKYPQSHPKTPLFLAWTWKWAKWATVWAKWTPTGQNVWKVGQKVLEVGKNKLAIFTYTDTLPHRHHKMVSPEHVLDHITSILVLISIVFICSSSKCTQST